MIGDDAFVVTGSVSASSTTTVVVLVAFFVSLVSHPLSESGSALDTGFGGALCSFISWMVVVAVEANINGGSTKNNTNNKSV